MMMKDDLKITKIEIDQEERWNALLSKAYNSSYRLSFGFLLEKKLKSKKFEIYIYSQSGHDVAGAVFSLKTDSSGLIRVAETVSGILFRDKEQLTLLPSILDHLVNWAKKNKTSYIRFLPWLPMTENGEFTDVYQFVKESLEKSGFKPVKEGQHTYLIDLTQKEEELLVRMNQPTRKLIQRALKSKMEFKVYEEVNEELIESFWNLYITIAKKKKFSSLKKEAFFLQVKGLIERKQAMLFAILCDEKIISLVMASKLGTPQAIYGGIDVEYKNLENCISPGPISIWDIMVNFKRLGYKTYDMGFCPGPVPEESHPNFSVWKFKYNFGPEHMQFMPTYGKIMKPLTGRIFQYRLYKK